ncbi:hypothetical protein [Micrococcus luteus]
MAKDDEELPPICDVCLGAQGEWIYSNGSSKQAAKTWVECATCDGTGRK